METFKFNTTFSNVACRLQERQVGLAAIASLQFLHRSFMLLRSHSKVSKRDKVPLNCAGIIQGIVKY